MVKLTETKDCSREEQILKAAEQVFLSKGYSASKTVEIAEVAGVNHALLHYYFRTKDNLFRKVFTEKIKLFIDSFRELLEQELPFFDLIRSIIEAQYDFIAANEKLPFFVINEVISNDEHRELFTDYFFPQMGDCILKVEEMLNEEIRKGTVKEINIVDLLLSIASLNVFYFILQPALRNAPKNMPAARLDMLASDRKKVHVDMIISWIKR